jgi:hypothetical protein
MAGAGGSSSLKQSGYALGLCERLGLGLRLLGGGPADGYELRITFTFTLHFRIRRHSAGSVSGYYLAREVNAEGAKEHPLLASDRRFNRRRSLSLPTTQLQGCTDKLISLQRLRLILSNTLIMLS